jgi:hypothetical protein
VRESNRDVGTEKVVGERVQHLRLLVMYWFLMIYVS